MYKTYHPLSPSPLTPPLFLPLPPGQVTNLLELVRGSSKKMAEAQGLLFDELANIIEQRQLHSSIEVGLNQRPETLLELGCGY